MLQAIACKRHMRAAIDSFMVVYYYVLEIKKHAALR